MHASFAISSSSPIVFPNKWSGGIISVGGGELIDDENISKTFEAKEHSTERFNKEHTAERLIKTTKFCLKVDETNEYSRSVGEIPPTLASFSTIGEMRGCYFSSF